MAYAYRRSYTIDHTQVGGTDLSNFPVLVSVTDAALKSVANGGHVTSASGYDLIVCSDAAGMTQFDHEIESYDPTTGTVVCWVRVPSLSHSIDTVLYLFYGNASVTTSQEHAASVWDANYKAVYHLKDNAASTAVIDSTGLSPATSRRNTSAMSTTGQIGEGFSFVRGTPPNDTNSDWLSAAQGGRFTVGSSGFTGEGWVQPNGALSNAFRIVSWYDGAQSHSFGLGGTGLSPYVLSSGSDSQVNTPFSSGTLHHVMWVYDGAGGYAIYVDGILSPGSIAGYGIYTGDSTTVYIGQRGDGASTDTFYPGLLDELRFSIGVRSAGWALASYNNQGSPSTFATLGSEQAFTVLDAEDGWFDRDLVDPFDTTTGGGSVLFDVTLGAVQAGTTYPVSRAESVTAGEGVTATLTAAGARTEALTAADAPTGTLTAVGGRTEALTAAESATGALTTSGAAVDTLSAAEAVTGGLAVAGAVTESLSATESQSGIIALSGAASDTLSGADTETASLSVSGARAESVTASDTESATAALAGSRAESLTAAETESAVANLGGPRSESLTAADAVIASVVAAALIAESLTVTDSATGTVIGPDLFTPAMARSVGTDALSPSYAGSGGIGRHIGTIALSTSSTTTRALATSRTATVSLDPSDSE